MSYVVVVVGGANLDIVARSDKAVRHATSNPGRTITKPGGVGRNIAENLGRLGDAVALVSVVGDDDAGRRILSHTAAAGVDVTPVVTGRCATGSYTAVLGPDGELEVAVADMQAIDLLRPGDLPPAVLGEAAVVVADGNLPADVLRHLLTQTGGPVMIDPVSAPKAARIAPLLSRSRPVHTLTPDRQELAAMTGMPVATDDDIARAAYRLLDRGVQRVWVRQGPAGSALIRADGIHPIPAVPANPIDVTGAGDAMLAAYAHGLAHGKDDLDAARDGAAAAYLTITSEHTVRPDLDEKTIAEVRRETPDDPKDAR